MINHWAALSTLVVGLAGPAAFGQARSGAGYFEDPVPISVDGQVVEFDEWLAAPALGDFFGNGRKDLLVGQHRGRLRIYRDVGTGGRPEFAEAVWFDEIMPEGEIPAG